ncbi:MAG: hypothetical protein KBF88_06670 [Polyangiaceae bacterium]|nr:hypothetical protein [Polyangiaceae bacterium]
MNATTIPTNGSGDALADSIEHLYKAFSAYPLSISPPCACCHEPEEEKRLSSAPLRELSPEHLKTFATDALLTWGSEPEYKHFLPRILELTATDGFRSWPDIQILIGRLGHAKWQTWPEEERAAIEAFLLAYWEEGFEYESAQNRGGCMEDLLCAIAMTDQDLTPYLAKWFTSDTRFDHLTEWLLEGDHSLSGGYWEDASETRKDQVRAWFKSDELRGKYNALAGESASEEEKDRFLRALEVLSAVS